MSDRIFYAGAAVLALVLVGLALVYPQGDGRTSPAPFGGPVHISDAAREDLKAAAQKAHPTPPAVKAGLRPAGKP